VGVAACCLRVASYSCSVSYASGRDFKALCKREVPALLLVFYCSNGGFRVDSWSRLYRIPMESIRHDMDVQFADAANSFYWRNLFAQYPDALLVFSSGFCAFRRGFSKDSLGCFRGSPCFMGSRIWVWSLAD
jgi:hypothetical protein